MSFPIFGTAEIRACEASIFASGEISPDALMQRAARGITKEILEILAEKVISLDQARILVLVGPGNNGGDGLYLAKFLSESGVAVDYTLVCGSATELALTAAKRSAAQELELAKVDENFAKYQVVVDAIFGIGSRGGLPEVGINWFGIREGDNIPIVIAVDIPSGMRADELKQLPGSVKHLPADYTIAVGGLKLCQVFPFANPDCGEVRLVDLGFQWPTRISRYTLADLARDWQPVLALTSKNTQTQDKYQRGVVGLDVGSTQYPGAGYLVTAGACGLAAGMIRHFSASEIGIAKELIARYPNIVLGCGQVDALVVGSGWGESPSNAERFERALSLNVPLVVDADALRYLEGKILPAGSVLTPHAGELARCLGVTRAEVALNPLEFVALAAQKYQAAVLLKGANQFVASVIPENITVESNSCLPDCKIEIAIPGVAWTAQAGSGDTLAGMVGALLAAYHKLVGDNNALELAQLAGRAALQAASIQAVAANHYQGPITPQDLAKTFGAVYRELHSCPQNLAATEMDFKIFAKDLLKE